MLIIRRSKLYYTASGIITPVGSRPVHRLREDYADFVIPDGCITLIQFYIGVLVLMYLHCLFYIFQPVHQTATYVVWRYQML